MSLYKLFKTDENLEAAGVHIEYGTAVRDGKEVPVRIKIARAGGANTSFQKALEKATKPYRKALQTGLIDPKLADKIYKEVFASTVVLGWENVAFPVMDEAGKVVGEEYLPFNQENALRLFEDLPDLFQDLREQAQNVSIFRQDVLENDLGNSGRSSAMVSSKDQ